MLLALSSAKIIHCKSVFQNRWEQPPHRKRAVSSVLSFFPERLPLTQVIRKGMQIFRWRNHRFLVADKRGCASFITAEDLHNLCDVQIADMVAGFFFRHGLNQHFASAVKSLDRALAQNDLRDPLPGQYDGMELAAAGISQGKHIPLSADPGGKEIQKPYC